MKKNAIYGIKKLSFQIHVTSKQIFAQQRVLKTAMHNTKILQKIKKFWYVNSQHNNQDHVDRKKQKLSHIQNNCKNANRC